ncbi:MAG: RluA family pseudouridine synthase [Bacteroidia bacterium]|nr:RluA family pseudouridine synthase [Bacteroidia bacterium]
MELLEPIHEHYRLRIGKNPSQAPLEQFLCTRIHKFNSQRFDFYFNRGKITVNGEPVALDYIAQPGDEIVLYSPYTLKASIEPVPMNLDIVYEDAALIVVNKPAGLVMHPGLGNHHHSLLHGLKHHFEINHQKIEIPNGIVHRIDKGTAGLVVVAKLGKAHKSLTKQFKQKLPERVYHALLHGHLPQDAGRIRNFTGRDSEAHYRYQVYPDDIRKGKITITNYQVLEKFTNASLVQCILETGRTHQIRLHMSHLGHPLLNDFRYDLPEWDNEPYQNLPGHALIAKTLGFEHPYTHEFLRFEINYPQWFDKLLFSLRHPENIPTTG